MGLVWTPLSQTRMHWKRKRRQGHEARHKELQGSGVFSKDIVSRLNPQSLLKKTFGLDHDHLTAKVHSKQSPADIKAVWAVKIGTNLSR